jgi:glucose-6-phosphate 1-dehydrogenase
MGDLAHKKIFPALYHMVHRGHLDLPIIGVAKAGRSDEHLKERARDSVHQQGGSIDEDALAKLLNLAHYVVRASWESFIGTIFLDLRPGTALMG